MVIRYKFFVHCSGWANGGYTNTDFALSEAEAKKRIEESNLRYKKAGVECHLSLLSMEQISNEEFAEDYLG